MKNIFFVFVFLLVNVSAMWKELANILGLGFEKSPSKNLLAALDIDNQLEYHAMTGNVDQVKELLKNPKIRPSSSTLMAAAATGKSDALKILLQDGRANPLDIVHDTLYWAVYEKQVESVRVLLQDPRVRLNSHDSQVFLTALRSENTEIINLLLADPRFDAGANNNIIIRNMARKTNDLDLFKRILKMPNVDPAVKFNDPLMGAVLTSKVEVAKLLLQDQRVLNGNYLDGTLLLASQLRSSDMVRVLLQCEKIRPSFVSVTGTNPDIVKAFLESPRVDPAAFLKYIRAESRDPLYLSYFFRWSVESSNDRLIKFFLTIKTLNPSSNSNAALKLAIKNERLDIVRLLLADDRVDPSLDRNEILEYTRQLAAAEEQKIIDAFSGEKKVNSDKLLALRLAVTRKFDNIQDVLSSNEKVNLAIKQNSIS